MATIKGLKYTDKDGNLQTYDATIEIGDNGTTLGSIISSISTTIDKIYEEIEGMTKAIQQLNNTIMHIFGGTPLTGTGAVYSKLGTDQDPSSISLDNSVFDRLDAMASAFASSNKYYYTIRIKTLNTNLYSIVIDGVDYRYTPSSADTTKDVYQALTSKINDDEDSEVIATYNSVISLQTKNPSQKLNITVSDQMEMVSGVSTDLGSAISELKADIVDTLLSGQNVLSEVLVGKDKNSIKNEDGSIINIKDTLKSSSSAAIAGAIRAMIIRQEYSESKSQILSKTNKDISTLMDTAFPELSAAKKAIIKEILMSLKRDGVI